MKKKKEQPSEEKKLISNKRLAILSMVLVAVIVLGFLLAQIFVQPTEVEFPFRAAIIDQVGENFPSSPTSAHEFNETVTNLLEHAGFNVSYHKSTSITVNFFRGLAKFNYGIIILRAHSALRETKTLLDIFTSEEFKSSNTYSYVTKGNYTWQPGKFYFAITPEFIENLEGVFPKSIVIAMGCWSLKSGYNEMADAFIKKGAKAYIGWTDAVSMSHTDNSTIRFLRYFLANKTISEAIGECNMIPDPEWDPGWGSPAELAYLPFTIGEYKLSDFAAKTALNKLFIAAQAYLLSENEKLYHFKNCRLIFCSV